MASLSQDWLVFNEYSVYTCHIIIQDRVLIRHFYLTLYWAQGTGEEKSTMVVCKIHLQPSQHGWLIIKTKYSINSVRVHREFVDIGGY